MDWIRGNEKDGDRNERGLCNKTWWQEIEWKKDDGGRDLFQRKENRQYPQAKQGDGNRKKRQWSQMITK